MPRAIDLDKISEEELLCLRICDLPLTIQGTWLEECIRELYQELADKQVKFRPVCYLADEWLTPQNEPVIGLPFYLAHPTLLKLEKKMMLDAEGESKAWCMKLLRHETGHALTYAYRFHRRKKWQEIFGSPSVEYGDTYRFRPYSKNFVRHLEDYYAQYHPEEDFVETFAVWLTPNSNWQEKYQGWQVLRKLQYVDQLMQKVKGKDPLVKSGTKYWRTSTLRITLKNFYKKKRQHWAEEFPDFHDKSLKDIFLEKEKAIEKSTPAADLLKIYHREILGHVAKWTGERKYLINDLIKKIRQRCRALKLVTVDSEAQVVVKVTSYVNTLVMNYRYTGRLRGEKHRK